MIDQANTVASKLQVLKENDLTRTYIIPLLESLGYHKIEFFGGPAEEGKDIMFWERSKFEDIRLIVAQVKHLRLTNTAADKNALQTVVNQLTQCFMRKFPYTDKTMHYPTEAIVITSHPVDTRTLMTRFNEQVQLKDQQITIIDGLKLASLLINHQSHLIKNLLGIDFEINSKIEPSLNNKILLSALGSREEKSIKSIFTDIDFSLGKHTTHLFFNSLYHPSNRTLELDPNELAQFCELTRSLSRLFTINFIDKRVEDYESMLRKHLKDKELYLRQKDITKQSEILKSNYDRAAFFYETKKARKEELEKRIRNYQNQPEWQQLSLETNDAQLSFSNLEKEFFKIRAEQQLIAAQKPVHIFKIKIGGSNLVESLLSKRDHIEKTIKEYNKSRPTTGELKQFIQLCKDTIETTKIVFDNRKYFSCIGLEDGKTFRKDFETTRLKIPIDTLFDTELNFMVIGEAGAGKTTNMQMYMHNRKHITDRQIIWLPLARMMQNALDNNNALNELDLKENFEKVIYHHLVQIGAAISLQEFQLHLNKRKLTFLFDGIDEAIKPAPWLPAVISKLAIKYKENIQIIVTSRMSGSYLDEIPFFTLTLLPFTPEQRDKFIDLWFADGNSALTVNRIKSHVKNHKAIGEIISNPLLATTLCVLAKHQLPLPKTEIDLYDSRIKLLTGRYDNVKRIESRVTVTQDLLEELSKKIAFYLHSNNKREEHIHALSADIRKITNNEMDSQEAIIGLTELVDPCNILVPMSEDGKFGFGHLKYQEHLAAKEIVQNRGIDILPLLKHQWWHEVLILAARMFSSLDWFIKMLDEKGKCSEFELITYAMIQARPKKEQYYLEEKFKNMLLLESEDSFPDRSLIDDDSIWG